MTLLDTILTVAAGLFGGLNILQLVFFRQTKEKASAEASSAATGAAKEKSDLHQSQYDYVIEKLSMYQKMYFDLNDRVMEDSRNYTRQITEGLDEIAQLKSRVLFWRGVSCGRYDCPDRIAAKGPTDDEPQSPAPESDPEPTNDND